MIKKISVSFFVLSLFSIGCNAADAIQGDTSAQEQRSYACQAMLDRGSEMFCQKDRDAALQKVAAVTAEDKRFFACDTMAQYGSEMFCQKGDAYEELNIAEAMAQSARSYACDTMVQRGSEMFCQKEPAYAISHIK